MDNKETLENFGNFMEEFHYFFSNEALTKEKFQEILNKFKINSKNDIFDKSKNIFLIENVVKAEYSFSSEEGKETFRFTLTLAVNNEITWGTKPALTIKYRNTKNIKYKGDVIINENFLMKDSFTFNSKNYTSREEKDLLLLLDIDYSGVDKLKIILNKIYYAQKPMITLNLESFLIKERFKNEIRNK